MGLYGTGAIMYGDTMISIACNSVIPGSLIYKREGSTRKATKTGDILIGHVAWAQETLVKDYWLRIRKAQMTVVGPIKYMAWGGEWHKLDKNQCLVGLIYWNYCYHWSLKRHHAQWMITFIASNDSGTGHIDSPIIVDKGIDLSEWI